MPYFQIDRKLLLMKIHYFIGIGGYAPFSPFLTTIAKQRGYSAFIVGLIFMLQPIPGLVVRPVMGAITDKYKCRRSVFIACTIITFLLVCLLSIIPGTTSKEEINDLDVLRSPTFWLFFGTITLINADGTIRGVLEDTICMDLLGENKHNYGKQRLWGSVGWSLCAMMAGAMIDWFSKDQEFKNYTPGFIFAMILFFLDIIVVCNIEVKQNKETKIVASDVRKVFAQGKVLAFLLWVVLFGFFMSFIWNFVFWYLEDLSDIYHPETKSYMKTLQGVALIIQCFLGEVPSFFLSTYILKRVGHMQVFSWVFFTFTMIFTVYSFNTDPLWALPVEVFNGVIFAVTYSAAIAYASLMSPVGAEGTLQGVVGTAINGLGAPLGSFVGGYTFKRVGSIESFRILSVVGGITFITQIVVNRLINRFSKDETAKDTAYSIVATKDTEMDEEKL